MNKKITNIKNIIAKIMEETEVLSYDFELLQIYKSIEQTKNLTGSIAEVGVYKGGTAKLICESKGNKKFYLFDTFSGHPEVSEIDLPRHYKGRLKSSYKEVCAYLNKYQNIFIYKGIFPSTSAPIINETFSFVNLDADLYRSILESLDFFYPRMVKGGIIIIHDYHWLEGVRKAVDDFFIDKIENVKSLRGSQCFIKKK
ncbi:hypothetical protein A2307_02655 [Candidatus Peregrinibacteria bacterium RIFOXYB2_FULL_33_20]|nr:MAG: hypothetical protein A2263_01450 [Candidatus Peregrinibacteria bacterium RIFOXYA2_FULL_33_21]OGJ51423.1 MAG: hypothetical protein A2307_02655 [Candidatus Peregrinibacteria bacterium RIFOXYB2_FULL_33_20]